MEDKRTRRGRRKGGGRRSSDYYYSPSRLKGKPLPFGNFSIGNIIFYVHCYTRTLGPRGKLACADWRNFLWPPPLQTCCDHPSSTVVADLEVGCLGVEKQDSRAAANWSLNLLPPFFSFFFEEGEGGVRFGGFIWGGWVEGTQIKTWVLFRFS